MLYVTGCVPLIVGGGIAAGGYAAVRDKRVGDSITDSKIEVAIKAKLYKISPKLYSLVSVNSDEGAVLLTGVVPNLEWVEAVEKESWLIDGVVAVNNHVTHGEQLSVKQTLQDDLITSKVRSKILCCKGVRSVNYKIKTMDGVVYVRGIAQTSQELEFVISELRSISGVKKIVSYVDIKS
jgi:osmotically-inducible protein OsmY